MFQWKSAAKIDAAPELVTGYSSTAAFVGATPRVAELVYAAGLKPAATRRRAGSTPAPGTTEAESIYVVAVHEGVSCASNLCVGSSIYRAPRSTNGGCSFESRHDAPHPDCNEDEATTKENIMKLVIEIRGAEGGDDAKALVITQAAIYQSFAKRHGLKVAIVEQSPG